MTQSPITNPAAGMSIEIPEVINATLSTYIPQIDMTWDTGNQIVTTDRQPYSRTYSILSFPGSGLTPVSNTSITIDLVNLGAYVDEYKSDHYYLLRSYFLEDAYQGMTPFYNWTHTQTNMIKEERYLDQVVTTLVWNRPILGTSNQLTGTQIPVYQDLPDGYIIPLVQCNNGIACVVSSSDPIQAGLTSNRVVTQPSTPPDQSQVSTISPRLLLTQPYITTQLLNVTPTSHAQVTYTFYGTFHYRSIIPADEVGMEVLTHLPNVPLSSRLIPPNPTNNPIISNLPQGFWNSNPVTNIERDSSSTTGGPSFIG